MKIRNGFVSNSSSSSFVINKEHLTKDQIELIIDHEKHATKMQLEYADHYWQIEETESKIQASTIMDNFDMYEYLKIIGVNSKHVIYDEDFDVYEEG